MSRKISLIGAPFDLCGPVHGSRLGPIALRLHDLPDVLKEQGWKVTDEGDAFDLTSFSPPDLAAQYLVGIKAYQGIKSKVESGLKGGSIAVVLGGDHSLSIGSVAGAIAVHGPDLAVLWIDAHMDAHTPGTTTSGNVHGMPLGALARLSSGSAEPWSKELAGAWSQILDQVVPNPGLKASQAAWIGLRDVDAGEVSNFAQMEGSFLTTMQDVDRRSIGTIAQEFHNWMLKSGATKLWISFDVDCLDPIHAPGTGTAVRGGLTYREGHLLAEILFENLQNKGTKYELVGVDLVEVNPLQDTAGETARVTTEWAGSLFGKSILGSRGLR